MHGRVRLFVFVRLKVVLVFYPAIVQGQEFNINCDFKFADGKLSIIEVLDDGTEKVINPVYKVIKVDGVPSNEILVVGGVGALLLLVFFIKRRLF